MDETMGLIVDEGYMARARGACRNDNPHPPGSEQHADWQEGCMAYDMDLQAANDERDMRLLLTAFRL